MEKVRKCAHCKAAFSTPAVVFKKRSFCCVNHRMTFERLEREKVAKARAIRDAKLEHEKRIKARAKRSNAAKTPREKVAFSFSW